jgi:hypothetical protein
MTSAHEERGLKHRPAQETRRVPIPPELAGILRDHVETFGVTADGRMFSSERGKVVASTTISDVWAKARTRALTRCPGRLSASRPPLRPAPCRCIAVAERRSARARGGRESRAWCPGIAAGLRRVP